MNIIDLHTFSPLEEPKNQNLIQELNSLVVTKMSEMTPANLWVFRSWEAEWDDSNLIQLVQEVRSKCLSNIYLRWTDMLLQQEALERWVLSGKVVDCWYEDDVGLVAAYKIPTWANNISNQYFAYKFFLTVLSSLAYALKHSNRRRRQSLILFAPVKLDGTGMDWDIDYSLQWVHKTEISRDTRREDLLFWDKQFTIFRENQSERAFKNRVSETVWTVVYIPQYTEDTPYNQGWLGIDNPFWTLSHLNEFLFSMAHIVTITLLKEIWNLNHLKDEYLGKDAPK